MLTRWSGRRVSHDDGIKPTPHPDPLPFRRGEGRGEGCVLLHIYCLALAYPRTTMNLKQMEEYRKEFGAISVGELRDIADQNDRGKYSAEELQAIHRMLVEKGQRHAAFPSERQE